MDFFTVEDVTIGGLVRCSVLFVIELSTRRVHIAGMTCQPSETWMRNMARHLTDGFDGFLIGKRYLILIAIRCSPEVSGGLCGAAAWSRFGCRRGVRT